MTSYSFQVHIVNFDSENKIKQIRQYWDQGSLLKSVEVVGARGRNWPLRDPQDQMKLLKGLPSTDPAVAAVAPVQETPRESRASTVTSPDAASTPRASSPTKKYIKDPHASLSLFEQQDVEINTPPPSVIAPRASAKPPPREYSELFAGGEDGPVSPSKVVAPKAGGAKKAHNMRLFGDELESTPDPKYKSHPKKFSHFDFHENAEADMPKHHGRAKSQHQSQWDFKDFTTPQKPGNKVRGQDMRSFTWSDDEVEETPAKAVKPPQPRRDARAHFDFNDEVTPQRAIIGGRNKGVALGLYKDHLADLEKDDEDFTPTSKPVSNAPLSTVPNGTHRKKDFAPHWDVTDSNPSTEAPTNENKPLHHTQTGDHSKALKMMEASWSAHDESPDPKTSNAAPVPAHKAPKKGLATEAHWGFGNEEEETIRQPAVGQKQKNKPAEAKGFWDF